MDKIESGQNNVIQNGLKSLGSEADKAVDHVMTNVPVLCVGGGAN